MKVILFMVGAWACLGHELDSPLDRCSIFSIFCLWYIDWICLFCPRVLQVAEMHGELIEFNERLYRSLMAKDHLIVQMRQELIDLRGPVSD